MANLKLINNIINQRGTPAFNSNTFANRPAAGYVGRIFISTDTFVIQRDNGTTWDTLGSAAGITGTGAAGQVTFFTGASAVSGDNTFFWDNTNKRLGLGTVTPGVRLDVHGTGVIQQLNGTTTNSSFLDFQNAGTTRVRIGNDYNGGAQTFAILNNSTSNYFAFGIQSNSRMGFNSPNLTHLGAAQFEFYNYTALTAFAVFQFTNDNTAAFVNTYKTRSTVKGSYSQTLTGDNLASFSVAGSNNSTYLGAANINFVQNGSVGTSVPTDILFNQYNATLTPTTRLLLNNTGFSTFADRVNIANATDNANYELNVNGNTYTGGISPTILTVSTNTNIARTATGYYVTATATLTLPTVSGLNNWYIVVAGSGATVTVQRNGTDTILDKTGASVTSVTVAANTRSMFYVGGGTITFQIF